MYSERFGKAIEEAYKCTCGGIGTYMERSQHRVLKFFFEPDPSFHEIPVSSYIADICKDGHIYEIQTSGFGNLTSKLENFLTDHKVTVVYPAAVLQTVVWSEPETGDVAQSRRNRRNSVKFKLLSELVHVSRFIGRKNFSIIVAETEINDIRLLDGRGAAKKIKATKVDKVPVGILSLTEIANGGDIKNYAELEDGSIYTRAELQKKFQLKGRNLSAAIKSLLLLGILKEHRREGRKIYYITCSKGEPPNDKSV